MSDFGGQQQQDFGEDGTRKEGGGRGAKFKSFMAGTKNKFSPLGKMKRRDNAEEQQQQQREEEESTLMMGDDVSNNEDGNDQKNNNNKFKRFVGRAGDALKKTGTAGVQLTKKAVANTKDRVQAIRKDQPSHEKEEEGEEIILMESEDNEDEDYSSEEPPNQAATTTTTTTAALEEETTTTTSMPVGGGLDLTEGGGGTSVNNEGGTAVEEEETALHQTVEGENQAETNQAQTENDNDDHDSKAGMAATEKETPEVKEEEGPTSSTPNNVDILLEKEEEEEEAAVAMREANFSLAVDTKDSEPEETTEPLNTTTQPPVEEEEGEDTNEKAPNFEEQAEALLGAVAQGKPPVQSAEEEEESPIDMEPTETSLPIDTKPRDEPPSVDSRDAPIDVAVQGESSPIIGADAKDDEPELVEAPETPAEQLAEAEEAVAEQATIERASGGIDNDLPTTPPVAPEISEESSASPQAGEILEKTVLETTAPAVAALEETEGVEDKAELEATKESEPDRQKETASAIKPKPEESSPPKKKGLRRLVTGTKNIVAKGKSLATKRGGKNDQDGGQKVEQSESGQDDQTTPKKAKGLNRLVTGTKTVSKKAVSKVKNIIPRGKSSEAESVTDDSTLGEGFTDDASTMSSGSDTKLGKPVNWSKNAVQKTRAKISNLVRKTSSADESASVGEKSLNVSEITTIDENKADEVIDDDDEEEVGADEVAVQMSPFLLYFLHDTVIATFGFSVVALIPTLFNWSLITQSQVPTSVFLAWMIFAFGVGQEIGRWKGMRAVPTKQSPAVRETSVDSSSIAIQTSTSLRNQKEGYALAMTLTKPLKVKLKFGARIKKGFKKLNKVRKKAWTALACGDNSAVDRYTWTKGGFVQIDDKLNNRLLRNPSFRRGSLQEIVAVEAMGEGAAAANDRTKSFRMGAFDDEAETLDDAVVMPACRLRGMDCFLTDNCEVDMAKHAFLVRNGLRKKPTFLLNLILNWCNILVYFEFPDWFKDFDSMVEHEDDSEEVKAIKRFVSGDDQYRNERLKVLPALAEGPMAIKMLMPSKKEMTVHGDSLPLAWTKYDAEELPDGTTLQPCLEVDLNVMASKLLSKTSSFVRRYVKSMALDVALTIGKADEAAACVGLFRFNKIDIDQCPELPDRNDDYDDDDDDDAAEAAG